jgi:hypothetical protein
VSGFLKRQLREITASIEAMSGRIFARAALVVLLLVFLLAGFTFLSVALYLWVAAMTRPLIAALAVGGLNIAIAIICLIVLLLKGRSAKAAQKNPLPTPAAEDSAAAARAERADAIDRTIAPLIAVLHDADMKPEEVALRLGAALTKDVSPLALVALALAAGFMFSRWLTGPNKK